MRNITDSSGMAERRKASKRLKKLARNKKIDSLIVSSDKDLMHLVNKNVSMLDPMKNKSIGINQVIEKFGVEPKKVIFIQALTGDKIDIYQEHQVLDQRQHWS